MFSALLISPDLGRCQILKSVALETGQVLLARIVEEYPHGIPLAKLLHVDPEVVLLDLVGGDVALRCAIEIRELSPKTPILGFAEQPSQFETKGSVAIDSFLLYPPEAGSLAKCINDAVRQAVFEPKENLLVFMPAKAGSGASTVAWNTAVALAESPARRVLIVDGDYRSGVLSFLIDERVEGSLQEILKAGAELDGFRFSGALTEREGVTILLSDRTMPEQTPTWETYARLVELAAVRFDPVLVDLPETVPPDMREILRRAGKVFLVTTPDVIALKLAARAYDEFLMNGIPKNRVHVVLNRWEENDLGSREVENFLHRPVAHLFPNDNRSVKAAVLRGEPIGPKTELWKSFRAFAAKLTAPAHPAAESLPGKLWSVLHR